MRKLNLIIFMGITACLGMVSCSKTVSEEDAATKQKSVDFQNALTSHKYKLVAFYSDKPIDYITSDAEVRSETVLRLAPGSPPGARGGRSPPGQRPPGGDRAEHVARASENVPRHVPAGPRGRAG